MSQPSTVAHQRSALDLPAGAHRSGSGDWFFKFNCDNCRDSGIAETLLGPAQCGECQAHLSPASFRVFGAISVLQLKQKPVDKQLLAMARALVPATAENPMAGEALRSLLVVGEREVKDTAKRLRDEWRLPAIGSRQKPRGYFFATSPEEFLSWMRTTRSQAISELATAYHLFKACFPQLAGQESLNFVDGVSTELQEAIR